MSPMQDKQNLDLPGVIVDAVEQMTKKSAEKVGEHVGRNFAEYFVSAAVATAAGSIIGVGFGALIEALLKGADRNEQMLNSLTSEPFATGTREVLHALSLRSSATTYRDDALKFGIRKLHSALTLAEHANDEDQQIFILFSIGISEAQLRGGLESSEIRFAAMREILAARIQKMNQDIDGLGSASLSQIEYEIRSRAKARLEEINADERKHWISAKLGAGPIIYLLRKATAKGTEAAEIATARDSIRKRDSLRDRQVEMMKLSEIISATVETIRQLRGIGGGA